MFIHYLYQYCSFETQQLLCRFMCLAIKVNYHSSTITIHMLSLTYKLPNVIHQKKFNLHQSVASHYLNTYPSIPIAKKHKNLHSKLYNKSAKKFTNLNNKNVK